MHKKMSIKPVSLCAYEEGEAKRISMCISKIRHGQFNSLGSLINPGFCTRNKNKNTKTDDWEE